MTTSILTQKWSSPFLSRGLHSLTLQAGPSLHQPSRLISRRRMLFHSCAKSQKKTRTEGGLMQNTLQTLNISINKLCKEVSSFTSHRVDPPLWQVIRLTYKLQLSLNQSTICSKNKVTSVTITPFPTTFSTYILSVFKPYLSIYRPMVTSGLGFVVGREGGPNHLGLLELIGAVGFLQTKWCSFLTRYGWDF